MVSSHRSLLPCAKKRALANLKEELGLRIPCGGTPASPIVIYLDGNDEFAIKRVRGGNDIMGNVVLGFEDN